MGKARGRPFATGNQSGHGRPKGSRNKKTLYLQELLEEHGEALLKKCMFDALQGDRTAMRLCLDRLLAPCRDGRIQVSLPRIEIASDVSQAGDRVLRAMQSGAITPAEGEIITTVLEKRLKMIETADLQIRIEKLEQMAAKVARE